MKIKKSEIKTCNVAYLYDDGHLVIWHEKNDKDAGKVHWVTIYESIGIRTSFDRPGRLIIRPGVLPFLSVAKSVRVSPASVNRGSENTKKKGIAVESIELRNGMDKGYFVISNFPALISSDIYYNENTEKFSDVSESYSWGTLPVKKVYRNKD